MGVFQSTDRLPTPSTDFQGRATVITKEMTVTGDIYGDADVELHGRIVGSVQCRNLRIGPDGVLEGSAKAEKVLVDGTIEGSVTAKSVMFGKNAHVLGDVRHEILEVEAGARMDGRYIRQTEEDSPKAAQSTSAPSGTNPASKAETQTKRAAATPSNMPAESKSA